MKNGSTIYYEFYYFNWEDSKILAELYVIDESCVEWWYTANVNE